MAITRWDLQSRINRLFGDPFARWGDDLGSSDMWAPPVEIFEKEDNLVMRAELPGMTEKDIEVQVENGVLTLRGEKKREQEFNQEQLHRAERYYGSFVRTFALPTTVDVDKIRASYKNGVLEVVLPRSETARAKRIEIKA